MMCETSKEVEDGLLKMEDYILKHSDTATSFDTKVKIFDILSRNYMYALILERLDDISKSIEYK